MNEYWTGVASLIAAAFFGLLLSLSWFFRAKRRLLEMNRMMLFNNLSDVHIQALKKNGWDVRP